MNDADWKITSVKLDSRNGGKGNVAVTCTNAGDGGLSIAIPLVGERQGFRLVRQHLAASSDAKTYFFQTPFSVRDLKTGTVKLFDENRVIRAEASIPFPDSEAPRLNPSQPKNDEIQPAKFALSETLNIREFGKATDESGTHRVLLNFVEVGHPEADKSREFYDFHSLVWESMDGNWSVKSVISKADFEKGCKRRRWVSKVQSMDSAGRTVLQIGEEGEPTASGCVRVIYSWREWDLTHNQEVRLIRVCGSPFEPFDGNVP